MSAIDYLKLMELYNGVNKVTIIGNIKKHVTINDIKYSNKWLCDITGMGIDMIRRYMTTCEMHKTKKFQLDQLCKISIALNVSLENLLT